MATACAAFPEVIFFIAPPGFRRKLDEARLQAAGIDVRVADSLDDVDGGIPAQALALIADERLLEAAGSAVDPCWIECLGVDSVAAAEYGVQPLLLESGADMLGRIVAPHGSAAHALDPAHWQELDLLRARAPDRVEGILAGYLGGVEERRTTLAGAVSEEALDDVGRIAHAWKGAAASVGADRLAAALSRIDHAARRGQIASIQRLVPIIEARSEAANRAISGALDGTGAGGNH